MTDLLQRADLADVASEFAASYGQGTHQSLVLRDEVASAVERGISPEEFRAELEAKYFHEMAAVAGQITLPL